jgi:hypothetical protein
MTVMLPSLPPKHNQADKEEYPGRQVKEAVGKSIYLEITQG